MLLNCALSLLPCFCDGFIFYGASDTVSTEATGGLVARAVLGRLLLWGGNDVLPCLNLDDDRSRDNLSDTVKDKH